MILNKESYNNVQINLTYSVDLTTIKTIEETFRTGC